MFDFNSESFIIHLSFKLIEFNVCSFQKNLRKIFQKMAFQKFYLFRKIPERLHTYLHLGVKELSINDPPNATVIS